MTGCAVSSSAGGNREKSPSGVEAAIKPTKKKTNSQVEGSKGGGGGAKGSQVAADFRVGPDFQPAWTNQQAISLMGIQTKPALCLHRNIFNYTGAKNRSQKESHTWDGS